MSKRVCLFLAVVFLAASAGCKGEPTAEDIEGWIQAGQFTKVNEFVGNVEAPMDLRVATIRKLVEYGRTAEIQSAMEEVKDRDKFIAASVEALRKDLKEDDETIQVESKDALFLLLPYLAEPGREELRKEIADWAFGGVKDDISRQALVGAIEAKRMQGQINRLDQHGIHIAALLVGHGVETQALTPYLATAEGRENQLAVIKAAGRLFKMENLVIPWGLLDVTRRFSIPETVQFLVDVYLNAGFPDDARSSALAAGQDIVYGQTDDKGKKTGDVTDTAEKRKVVIRALQTLMTSSIATDRWDAADMMLHVGGEAEVDTILGGMKADLGSYVRFTPEEELEMPDFVIIEMCRQKLKKKTDVVRPILEGWLTKGDAVQLAISVLCLKVLGQPASVDKLTLLLEGRSTEMSLETFFFSRPERAARRPKIEDGSLTELSVAQLAQNAIDGIKLLAEVDKAVADKSLSGEMADLKRESIRSVIGFTGDFMKVAVEASFAKKKAKAAAEPETSEPKSDEMPEEDKTGDTPAKKKGDTPAKKKGGK